MARGRRGNTDSPGATTAPVGVLRIDGIAVKAGYSYVVRTNTMGIKSTVAGDIGIAEVRYSTSGAATTASTQLPGAYGRFHIPTANISAEAKLESAEYVPVADETLSILLCVNRQSGTGTIQLSSNGTTFVVEMKLLNNGGDVADTGVDL